MRVFWLIFFLIFIGCGGQTSSDNGGSISGISGGSGGGSTVSPASSTFLYRVGTGTDQIFYGSVNLTSGALVEAGNVALSSGSQPNTLASTFDHKFLYVGYAGTHAIGVFSLDSTSGLPTSESVTSILTAEAPVELVMDPLNRFLFCITDHNLFVYSIDSAGGSLFLSDAVGIAGGGGTTIAVDPTGANLYRASAASGLQAYSIASGSGALTSHGSVFNLDALKLKMRPGHAQLYTPEPSGDLSYFAIGGGGDLTFTNFTPSNTTSPFSYNDVIFDSSGNFAYLTKSFDGTIEAYGVSGGGDFTILDSVTLPSGCSPNSLSLIASGNFIYTSCTDGSGKTVGYKINGDGSLDTAAITSTVTGLGGDSTLAISY